MDFIGIRETFDQAQPDSRLNWFNPPQSWHIVEGSLIIQPEAGTDFWQKTHYGFAADNGHFLYAEVSGDFVLSTQVRFEPVHQYDQAGLMVRLSSRCWLKTSVEYEPEGPARLGAVVTNSGFSDWSTQNFLAGKNELRLRVRREGSDYLVEYAPAEETGTTGWTQIRLARLLEDDGQGPVQAGLYACSPTGAGYVARFDFLEIEPGRTESDRQPEPTEISPITPADRSWLTALLLERWGSGVVVSRGQVHRPETLPGFVARQEDQPVGLITYRLQGEQAEIVTIDSLVENQGIGAALIEAVRQAAKAAGCTRLWLITTNDNLEALRFYQKRGFALVRVHPRAVDDLSRPLKPEIPQVGRHGLPIRDELELELRL